MQNVVIVGTGLIGSSFGLALRQAGFDGAITGVSSPAAIADALAVGAIDRGASLDSAIPAADLVFLSQTIGPVLDTVRHLDPLLRPVALVTDAGSTKCNIVDLARCTLMDAQFLGGHPMAGKETRGALAASADLFRDRTWILTPDYAAELHKQDTTAAGPVKVILWVSTTSTDTDFTAKLVDVSPDGYARNLTDGILRLRYRNSLDKPELANPGQLYQVTVDAGVTGNVFLKGHRIRIEISSSNFPRFDRNPNTGGPVPGETRLVPATETIYHDSDHPSCLSLTVIPPR